MNLEQLNSYAAEHKKRKSSETFRSLYDEAKRIFFGMHESQITANRRGEPHDAQESFDDVVMRLASRDDIVNFGETLSAALRNKRLQVGRDNGRRKRRYQVNVDQPIEQEDGSCTAMYEHRLKDELSAEVSALFKISQKKEAEKRQLLNSLVDRMNDPIAMAIATQNDRFNSGKFSVNALGKELGIHHTIVGRKLSQLARQYDRKEHGDIRDYLPDGMRIKRDYLTA